MAEIVPINDPSNPSPNTSVGMTEYAVFKIFADQYANKLAYCHSHSSWFEFDGNIWRKCETPVAFHYIATLCAEISSGMKTGGAALQKARFVTSVETYAMKNPIFARSASNWDCDIWLLGTPDGTVDLRTGIIRNARPTDMITRSVAVGPAVLDDPDDYAAWTRFLDQATGGDAAMIRFLQQIAGMALTGDISEQALFFIYGQGGNGKGTFIHILEYILNTYLAVASTETFASKRGSGHPTELANLRGARLVTASETNEGDAWDEARIKQLTGGDAISARFMRQDFFTFLPQFTLVIYGNFQPELRTVDDAMRRRFNVIPFNHKPKRKDPRLEEKLRAEAPSILRWMIEGCLDWQRHGLIRPSVVAEATDDYFDDQNLMQQWLEQECRVEIDNDHLFEKTTDLFNAWAKYARASAVDPGNAKSFKAAMRRAGIRYQKRNGVRYYFSIELIRPDQSYGRD